MSKMTQSGYNPDVLSCLANLSNDEVFTPPAVVNRMLDLLPDELWSNPDATFLDPGSKTGVFLREIAKRLIVGLAEKIPDQQERIDHIFSQQLYGLAITELTSLVSRRSVYCSKTANSRYCVSSKFDDEQGNIRYRRTEHLWRNGKCQYCGASEAVFGNRADLETHAYQFIHTDNPQEIFNMKFDVIIGNPPYQLDDGGAKASATPIYHMFIEQAIKLQPRYLTMIVPARWFAGGRGLESFRQKMLSDNRIEKLVDYFNSEECFPGVDISGGICYFLWNRDCSSQCFISNIVNGEKIDLKRNLLEEGCDTFIRFNRAIPIYRKIASHKESSFAKFVSSQKPFGLRTYVEGKEKPFDNAVLIYSNKNSKLGGEGYIKREEVLSHQEWLNEYKVYVSRAYGERGEFPYLVIGKPFLGAPNTCCTETYLHIGPFPNLQEAENVISYMKTRFFRFMVLLIKNTQDAPSRVYSFVPLQDFAEPWTDEKLYAKYNLSADEIAFIESMIRPME